MPFEASYLNSIATHGKGILYQMGLVDNTNTELTGGGYARLDVGDANWSSPVNGDITLLYDKVFEVPAGATVAGWFITLTSNGFAGIRGSLTPETFVNGGQYRFVAANCKIKHDNLGE